MRLWHVERHAARRGARLKGTRRDPAYARFNVPEGSFLWFLAEGNEAGPSICPVQRTGGLLSHDRDTMRWGEAHRYR